MNAVKDQGWFTPVPTWQLPNPHLCILSKKQPKTHIMNKEIKAYLNDPKRDYQEGLNLLNKGINNKILVNNLAKKQNDKNWAKLEYELSKLAEMPIDKIKPLKVEEPAPEPEETEGEIINLTVLTEDQKEAKADQIAQELKDLFVQRCRLSNELADLPEDELKSKTEEVLAKKQEYNELAVIYKALKNGKDLEVDHPDTEAEKNIPIINAEVAILKTQMQPLREKVSKLKKKVEINKFHEKIKIWENELAQTEASLEALEQKKKVLEAGN